MESNLSQKFYESLSRATKSCLRGYSLLAVLVGCGLGRIAVAQEPQSTSQADAEKAEGALMNAIRLTEGQLASAGIKTAQPMEAPFSRSIKLTGKIALNEERLAHIYPIVSGQVEAVNVTLGDTVQEGEPLVTVHSREVGTAKLDLYQAKLQLELAQLKLNLQNELSTNTRELLESLRKQEEIAEVQRKFAGRTMGDYRERLLMSYAAFVKSEADVQRLAGVSDSGAISSKQLFAAQATRNADAATFFARLEQIDYELRTSQLQASQTVKEAETRVAVATTNLRIMGCKLEDLENIDPAKQGEEVSNYLIRAPFTGTVISKDVVLREQVRPDNQIMSIADMSKVWVEANVYEKDAPLLESLKDVPVIVRNAAWPDREFEAKIFFTGEIMDEMSRTISMRAMADNKDRLLKPGMFVTIELKSNGSSATSIQIPSSAIMEHAGSQFVFVQQQPGTYERRDVVLGESNGSTTVIMNGLSKTDRVVTSGGFILKSKMLESLMGEE